MLWSKETMKRLTNGHRDKWKQGHSVTGMVGQRAMVTGKNGYMATWPQGQMVSGTDGHMKRYRNKWAPKYMENRG